MVIDHCREYKYWCNAKKQAARYQDRERVQFLRHVCKRWFLAYVAIVHHDIAELLSMEFFTKQDNGTYRLGYHGRLCTIAQEAIDKRKWSIIMSARGFTKSLFFSQYLMEWLAINTEKLRVPKMIMASASRQGAVDKLNDIKRTIEGNAQFRLFYGDLKARPWNEDQIGLTTGFELAAKGAGEQHRGPHPGGFILDDPHSTEEGRSKVRRQNVLEWIEKDVFGQLENNDVFIGVGTNLNRYCGLSILAEDPETHLPRPGFHSFIFTAIEHPTERKNLDVIFREGTPLWGKKWSLDELQKRREAQGDRAFLSEYMNYPYEDDEAAFMLSWLRFVSPEEVPMGAEASYIIAYDPAFKQKDMNDYTGWCVLAISRRDGDYGFIYVLEAGQSRMSTLQKMEHIFQMQVRFNPEAIVIEEDADKGTLRDFINHEAAKRGMYPNVLADGSAAKDKFSRALGIQGLIEAGTVRFISGKYPELIQQMLMFRGKESEHDDMVDALVYALRRAQQIHLPRSIIKTEPEKTRIQAFLERKTKAGFVHPITGERMTAGAWQAMTRS